MAAYEQAQVLISMPASTDISGFQYCWVSVNGSGQLAVTTHGADAIGILQDVPNGTGRVGSVCVAGVSKLLMGGTVTPGAHVESSSTGQGVAVSSSGNILGVYLDSVNSASGEIHPVLVQPKGTA
jgi:hypothetical protein